jgi:hypothetical protein
VRWKLSLSAKTRGFKVILAPGFKWRAEQIMDAVPSGLCSSQEAGIVVVKSHTSFDGDDADQELPSAPLSPASF